MSRWAAISLVIATLFVAGQAYLYWRRRMARGLFRRLARGLGVAGRGARIDLVIGGHRIVLDAQVTSDDRPEELRLSLGSDLPGEFRLTRPGVASHYREAKHGAPAAAGAPFAGWHVRCEEPDQLVALASDGRVRELLEALAAVGFARVELSNRKLTALWPDFSWKPEDHQWGGEVDSLPTRVQRAAESLSDLATAAESALLSTGRPLRASRARLMLTGLLVAPLLLAVAGLAAILWLYDSYPTVSDGQLLGVMALVGTVLSAIYTAIAYRLLWESVQRVARTGVVGLVALFGFSLGSAAPILWWNGTGPQGPGARLSVEVVRVVEDSALASGRGLLVRKLIGEESPIEEWGTTRRAIVRSWRDDSLLGIGLSAEQFSALLSGIGRLSLTVFPGALGLEWYSDVAVHTSPTER